MAARGETSSFPRGLPHACAIGELADPLTGLTGALLALKLRLRRQRLLLRALRKLWRLTPKGRAHFADMAHAHEAWVVDAFAALTEREQDTLHRILGKVKQHSQTRTKDTP